MKTLKIIHAGADVRHYDFLKKALALQLRNGLIKLTDEVGAAQLVAVLLSADFIADEHAWVQSEEAKRRYRAGECRIVPIYVEALSEAPEHLASLVCLPRSGKPAKNTEDWATIASEFRTLAMA